MNELQTLNERISEKVGKELVDLIPKEQWQAIVDNEVLKFKRETVPSIIKEMLTDTYKEKTREYMDKLTTTDGWQQLSNNHLSSELKKLIAESSAEIFAGMLSYPMQQVMMNLRSQLGQ